MSVAQRTKAQAFKSLHHINATFAYELGSAR